MQKNLIIAILAAIVFVMLIWPSKNPDSNREAPGVVVKNNQGTNGSNHNGPGPYSSQPLPAPNPPSPPPVYPQYSYPGNHGYPQYYQPNTPYTPYIDPYNQQWSAPSNPALSPNYSQGGASGYSPPMPYNPQQPYSANNGGPYSYYSVPRYRFRDPTRTDSTADESAPKEQHNSNDNNDSYNPPPRFAPYYGEHPLPPRVPYYNSIPRPPVYPPAVSEGRYSE
ncbi:hypothetical protein TI04_08715 [Achromatium sp. WMS2]|nr:hypothetical protein TI04_08715 [Achromatium sp. WMS2]